MRGILVSVVITTYKRDIKYVQEAIDSVVLQTYKPIEIILVDDNGMNSSFEEDLRTLCNNKEVIYLQNENNCGAQISRNNGIKASKGQFIGFLDDDDIWAPTKIEKQMSLFTDDSVGMVFCDGFSFYNDDLNNTGEFREASIYDRPISHRMELFNDWIGSTSQALIRRSVFEKVGMFDPKMPARQDYEMWLRITKEYKIVGVNEKLLYYRVHAGDRISTNWEKCLNSYTLVYQKYKEDYDNYPYAKAKLVLYMAKFAKKKHEYVNSANYFVRAFVTSPRCIADVIFRKIQKKKFAEFYIDKMD